ncbi:dTDP-4-dehydrorhamnose reductase [Candidatus Pacearchaeota archaeon]|nr:dTDP-4-dehydrorhamnose reductase [Candidatus Pacearchaeota archaeon]
MILLLGANGYVAEAFMRKFEAEGIDADAASRDMIDYTDHDKLWPFLKANAANIDVLINCAGYVGKPNVDTCELHKEECIKGNVLLPHTLSKLCNELMIKFMHISSGCVYGGYEKDFTEEDPPNFCFNSEIEGSFYSGTKALAEQLINKENSWICRLRIPFDEYDGPRNYLSKLQNYDRLLSMKNSVSHRADFVDACTYLIQEDCPAGIYNVTNTGGVDAEQVCALMREHLNISNNFSFFDSEEEFYKFGAVAPRSNCLLDNSKLLSTGFKMRDTVEAMEDSLKNWR